MVREGERDNFRRVKSSGPRVGGDRCVEGTRESLRVGGGLRTLKFRTSGVGFEGPESVSNDLVIRPVYSPSSLH